MSDGCEESILSCLDLGVTSAFDGPLGNFPGIFLSGKPPRITWRHGLISTRQLRNPRSVGVKALPSGIANDSSVVVYP